MPHLRRPQSIRFLALIVFALAILLNIISFAVPAFHTPTNTQSDDRRYFPTQLERETQAAAATVKRRENFSEDVDALFLCHHCAQHDADGVRVIALVELRNVATAAHDFLSALAPFVDGVVALDDHSDDGTRTVLLERCASMGHAVCKLDLLLNKTGTWTRQELRDRMLLLRAGRRVGGTHFILLDYDERFSATCGPALRDSIRALPPGSSLFIPWVELWKAPTLHRVLPGDRAMNFLLRRQTVVFADDSKVTYEGGASGARLLGKSHNASIHALRCPRTVCPRPPRYAGPRTPLSSDARVRVAPRTCRVLEARFLHVANAQLKAAWYEALGRTSGAPSSTTRGKMLDVLYPRTRQRTAAVALERVDVGWLSSRAVRAARSSRRIEHWRAVQLVRWLDMLGDRAFDDLAAVRAIDVGALRTASARAGLAPSEHWLHVPLRKRGTLVIAVGRASLAPLLQHVDGRMTLDGAAVGKLAHEFMSQAASVRPNPAAVDFEAWVLYVVSSVRAAVSKSTHSVATLSVAGLSTEVFSSLVRFASLELAQFDVVFAFALADGDADLHGKLSRVARAATRPGSHIRALTVHASALGSLSALSWLRYRICGNETMSADERGSLLSIAEHAHERKNGSKLQPVARVIFSLNVGRSGSKYVAEVFASLGRGVRGVHEARCPDGKCSGGGAMPMQTTSLEQTYDARLAVKVPMVRDAIADIALDGARGSVLDSGGGFETCAELLATLRSGGVRLLAEIGGAGGCSVGALKDAVYAETNPNFKSWFYDVTLDTLPAHGYAVTVLVIRKHMAAALMSLYETGYFTSRKGYNWMETSNGVNAAVRTFAADGELDAFDNIISYLVNAEAVTRRIVAKYNGRHGVAFVHARAEDLYSSAGALRLLRTLALRATALTMSVVGRRADKYAGAGGKKKRLSTTLKACERRVRRYLARCKLAGIDVPRHMSQLERFPGFKYREA